MALFEDYMNQILRQSAGVQAGTTKPWELPEFKFSEADLTKAFHSNLAELMKILPGQGYTGGMLNKAIADLNEQYIKGRLGAQRGAWEGATGQGLDIAKFQSEQAFQQYLQPLLAKMGIKSQEKIAKMGQITSAFPKMQGGCCFIFIEGDRLTDNVKNMRDTLYPKGGIVENGYRRLAKWLVPKMQKSILIKQIVKYTMLEPICAIADNHYGENSYGWIFIPVGYFWKEVFTRLGHDTQEFAN